MGKKSLIVVNPSSSNGTTRKEWPRISEEISKNLDKFEYVFTTGPGNATDLTRQALHDGFNLIVAVGGDGTNNEVINGFFENGKRINPRAVFAHITRGTGGDFRKTIGTPKNYVDAAKVLSGKATQTIDVGYLTFLDHQDKPAERYFINVASFGIGGDVDSRVNKSSKAFGGFASFAMASITSIFTYHNKQVHLVIDKQEIGDVKIFNCAVANGKYFGGGMMVAPDAQLDDGMFDIILLGDFSVPETLLQMNKIYRGGHIGHPKVQSFKGKKVVAKSDETVLLDIDGEQPGKLPATFKILPKSLKVKVMDQYQ